MGGVERPEEVARSGELRAPSALARVCRYHNAHLAATPATQPTPPALRRQTYHTDNYSQSHRITMSRYHNSPTPCLWIAYYQNIWF